MYFESAQTWRRKERAVRRGRACLHWCHTSELERGRWMACHTDSFALFLPYIRAASSSHRLHWLHSIWRNIFGLFFQFVSAEHFRCFAKISPSLRFFFSFRVSTHSAWLFEKKKNSWSAWVSPENRCNVLDTFYHWCSSRDSVRCWIK